MKFRYVTWEVRADAKDPDARVGLLTLNRPDHKNAIGPRMALELDAMMDRVRDSDARVVVIRGAGNDFCAGGDLKEETLPLERPEDGLGIVGEFGELAAWFLNDHYHVVAQQAFRKLEDLAQPTIAAIDGAAVGGGFELTLGCDLRIITDQAKLAEIAVGAGFVSEWGCARNLPKLIGLTLANELILTGRFVSPDEALRIGLVNRVVPPERLEDEVMAMAFGIARLPWGSVRAAKELVKLYNNDNRSRERSNEELERVLRLSRGEDSAEMIAAMLEKRPPRWRR